jgi:two-component system, NarL family, invasion response regulator UvrY
MIRVLLVDDHTALRKGLIQILNETDLIQVKAEAGTAREALSLINQMEFDLVILDISLPDRSGLDLIKDIRKINDGLPILIFSMYPDDQYAIRAIKSGANGYLNKDSTAEKIITAIKTVSNHKIYISEQMIQRFAFQINKEQTTHLHDVLSEREYYVLCKLGEGKRISEIAGLLSLSIKTVSTYKSRILKKMGLTNLAELALYVNANNLHV